MNLYDMLLPESPYVFYDVDHGFCINTEDVLNLIEQLPPAQPENRLTEIADLVEGTIDHFELDDAMDLLYQIKEVLKNG